MNDNHKLETILTGLGTEPVPQDVHRLAESVVDEFRRSISAGPDAASPEAQELKAVAQLEKLPTGEDLIIARDSFQTAKHQPETAKKRSINVGRIIKIAAAFMIVVGLGSVLTWLMPDDRKTGIVFADVVRHFTQAHTAKYTVTIELEGHKPVSIRRLQIFENKSFFENKSWLWDKSGPMGIQMLPRDWASSGQVSDPMSEAFAGETLYFFGKADGEGIRDFFELMGQVYERSGASLGHQDIDGQPAVGFRFEQDGTDYSIWAGDITGLPLRIEITNQRLLGKGNVTLREFKFDVEIPSPPLTRFGFGAEQWKWSASEEELLNALRKWAERHKDQFPRYLTHQAWFFKTPRYFLHNPDLDLETRQKIFKLTSRVIIKGLMFASQLPAGDNWNYMGNGMSLDSQDGETPICWYRPEDSETYHVIYRDLSVRNLTADELPILNVTE